MVLFFTHIPFVVNHTINVTPPERLQHYEVTVVICQKFVTCTNKHKRCCYLPFSLSLVYNELRNVLALQCIFWPFSLCVSLPFAFTANLD